MKDAAAAVVMWQRAEGSADVGDLIGGGNGQGIKGALGIVLMDEAVLDVDVLAARTVELLVHHFDAGLVVFVEDCRHQLAEAKLKSELARPNRLLYGDSQRHKLGFRRGSSSDGGELCLPAERGTVDEESEKHAALATESIVGP